MVNIVDGFKINQVRNLNVLMINTRGHVLRDALSYAREYNTHGPKDHGKFPHQTK